MLDFIQMVVGGIAVGSAYALMGLAMVIIYKTSEVPNFAQGEMALASFFLAMMLLLTTLKMSAVPAFLLTMGFAVLLGCFLEFAILRQQFPVTGIAGELALDSPEYTAVWILKMDKNGKQEGIQFRISGFAKKSRSF